LSQLVGLAESKSKQRQIMDWTITDRIRVVALRVSWAAVVRQLRDCGAN